MGSVCEAKLHKNIKRLEGQTFGYWTVVSYSHSKHRKAHYNCVCKCGDKGIVVGSGLLNGMSKSCGCMPVDRPKLAPLKDRFEEQVIKIPMSDCHYWTGNLNKADGYGVILSYVNNQRRALPRQAHRVAYELYKGPITNNLLVLHNCDNKLCVNPDHLRLGTYTDNMIDLSKRGNHKTTPEIVNSIREDFTKGIRQSQLAKKYGFCPMTISTIVRGKSRRYV